MKIIKDKNNRLLIYFFYDSQGIVDNYIFYMLNSLQKYIKDCIFVSNVKLEKDGKLKLKKITNKIIERQNLGLDVYAYKEALELYGFEKLKCFDEVILMNYTIMGPLFSFGKVFSKMNKLDIDFWGISKYLGSDCYPLIKSEYNTHIQSHFIVYRSSLLDSTDLKNFWSKMPQITSYNDSVNLYEIQFTNHFASLGYKYATYMDDIDNLNPNNCYPLMFCVDNYFKKCKCPIFKRKSFYLNYKDDMGNSNGDQTSKLIEFIENETNYDKNLIYENILRTNNIYDIMRSCSFYKIFDYYNSEKKQSQLKKAVFVHCFYPDLFENQLFPYLKNAPHKCDIFISTSSEESKAIIQKFLLKQKNVYNNINISISINRGRDISSLLVTHKKYILQYDLACFIHDKKVPQVNGSCGEGFAKTCLESVLGSKAYVENIIGAFIKDKNIGLIIPPKPNFPPFLDLTQLYWGNNYDNFLKLLKTININVPTDFNVPCVCPNGSMFWFRPQALKKLFDYDWKYEDFDIEPLKNDGTISHAIERIFAYVAQDSGYYTLVCTNSKYCSYEFKNYYSLLREFSISRENALKQQELSYANRLKLCTEKNGRTLLRELIIKIIKFPFKLLNKLINFIIMMRNYLVKFKNIKIKKREFPKGCVSLKYKNNSRKFINKICVYAFYSKNGTISNIDLYYLKALSKMFTIILIGDCKIYKSEIEKIDKYVIYAKFLRHRKYDFGSYFIGYKYAIRKKLIGEHTDLLLTNNSCIGPIFDLNPIIDKMSRIQCDFWGLNASLELQYHIQSYFMYFRNQVLKNNFLFSFLKNIKIENDYWDVVLKYESKLTHFLNEKGYVSSSFVPPISDYIEKRGFIVHSKNKMCFPVFMLNNYKFPFVKKKVFTNYCDNHLFDDPNDVIKLITQYNKSLGEIVCKEYNINTKVNNIYKK